MNCLLLLIILFCCNGNGGCNHCNSTNRNPSGRGCWEKQSANSCVARESSNSRSAARECDCETPQINAGPFTPPPAPRTQFPYLDVEPRTCGCEENQNA